MDSATLKALAARFQRDRDLIRNEEQTKQSLVIPFFRSLGYDPSDPREVRLEYTAAFTANDGKRLPDRMDIAIFDETGEHPLLVVETKPLGADVGTRSPQLSRYMSQMPELRFGIMTDGCHYLFYGDLKQPNVMDETPFFQFSLADPNLDFPVVAAFLTKFSRGQFSAEQMITDAEDSRYRQGMIRRLVGALQDPGSDEGFVRWLSDGVYEGQRTRGVMQRLGVIAQSTVKASVLRVLGDDFIEGLREQILDAAIQGERDGATRADDEQAPDPVEEAVEDPDAELEPSTGRKIVTTEEELQFAELVRAMCHGVGVDRSEILYKDTSSYFNVSHMTPTRWFVRFFGDKRRPAITTLVPTDEARTLAKEFDVEDSPAVFGVSRVYLDGFDSVKKLEPLILRSLAICRERRAAT